MELYHHYSPARIFLRRAAALLVGVIALPVMLFRDDRSAFYSYLHKIWLKTSDKPVWLEQSESVCCDFY